MARHTKEWLRELKENAWLGLGDTSLISTDNPFYKKTQQEIEQPHVHLLSLIRKPEYLGWMCRHILNKDIAPLQQAILWELWNRPFPMMAACRGAGKSFLLGLYAIQKALLNQGEKIVIIGAAFRQAKGVFEYAEEIWRTAPILRDIVGPGTRKYPNGPHKDADRWMLRIGDSTITALPLGSGERIRGQRGSTILVDEFATIPVDIFETVVAGFAAVASSPIEGMKLAARLEALKANGFPLTEEASKLFGANQTVIAGTAYYSFNHFYSYWKRYKAIVESRGDERKLHEIFNGDVPEGFNWRDYSVIRLPQGLLPPMYMDTKTVAKARATMSSINFNMEYEAIFSADSNGFYRRSIIENCVVPGNPPVIHTSCGPEPIYFPARLRAIPGRQYVMGVDPASEQDNFAIVILEVHPEHKRIVHCWTTKRSVFKERAEKGAVKGSDFYRYVARKIRELHKAFSPCELIALDAQGGGVAVLEALGDIERLEEGESPFYPLIDPEDPQPTDRMAGKHIISLVQFSRADWVSMANHGMRKDFEDRALLFPEFDAVSLGMAAEEDGVAGRLYDSLESCMLEIEELKDELASIVHSSTTLAGRDRWDTPEIKLPGGRKGRQRKDRYSALLMANAEARRIERAVGPIEMDVWGGFARDLALGKVKAGQKGHHQNPPWYTSRTSRGDYGAVVVKRRV